MPAPMLVPLVTLVRLHPLALRAFAYTFVPKCVSSTCTLVLPCISTIVSRCRPSHALAFTIAFARAHTLAFALLIVPTMPILDTSLFPSQVDVTAPAPLCILVRLSAWLCPLACIHFLSSVRVLAHRLIHCARAPCACSPVCSPLHLRHT
ncbi:hypothetical protein EVG20_g6910 [Dentipellis fragilis]|uniref:Uncharacterized protein n=1 Tax=Dentipellis fragilis TaxID=205917 RepID=A0A4Y9YJ19_9AGAM|nr:hypothetical protein EVG20_g6910 [Dentipellis fragilis]